MTNNKKWLIFLLLITTIYISEAIYANQLSEQVHLTEQALHKENIASRKLAFSSHINNAWQIWTINADGSNLSSITPAARDAHAPSWSPDGNKLAYVTGIGEIRILEQGKGPQKLPTPSQKCTHPSWSPDGTKIAFVCFSFANGQEESDIWITEIQGNRSYKLQEVPNTQKDPEWSPDGNSILYTTGYWTPGGKLREELWVMDLRDKSQRQLILNKACNIQPSWSPDGKWIAFASDQTGDMEIWVVDKNGQNAHRITHNKAYDADPCWSPDGEKIAFISTRDGKMDVWLMDKDGTNERKVTNVSEGDCKDPCWQ